MKKFDAELHCDRLQDLYKDTQQKYINYALSCPSLHEYLSRSIHEEKDDYTFVGTQDQVPQEIYDQMPERIKRKVQKVKPAKQKWKERPKGFVTYE